MRHFITVGELAEFLHCPVIGDKDKRIYGISLYEDSTEDMLTYVPYDKIDNIPEIKAGAILTRSSIGLPLHRNYILTRHDPYALLAQTVQFLIYHELYHVPSQEPPKIAESCKVGRFVTIGNGSVIEADTILSDGVVIGENARIGCECCIGANTVIGSDTVIGDNTDIGACSNIGNENFEYYQTPEKWIKIPVVGNVEIGHDVRISGNAVVEKGTIGTTLIGNYTQIDNLVQVGHEVRIGEHCHIVACVALAGWAEIGDHVTIYGQSAVSNRMTVGSHSVLLARSGVDKHIAENQIVSGFPAQNHQQELRFQAFLRRMFKKGTKGRECE